eukprot:TRINITY_DN9275_c0_g1_i1.p1 TRINITY_DN9275_c0_g1~~TRINITY_DN9275_c0_g1_i1.p1  ORF type:complete len:618 (+),score=90.64 TRINITY_DN9275_c0_g1_i1:101-1954(+)
MGLYRMHDAFNETISGDIIDDDPTEFKDLDFDEYLPSLTLLIFFMFGIAFFFEYVLRGLDHFLKRNAPQLYDIVQQLYKELMVCGFISIFLWLADYTGIISDLTSQSLPDILFDFIQLALFLSLGFYILFMFYLMFLSMFFMKRWSDIEDMDPGIVEQEYQEAREILEKMPWYERWFSIRMRILVFDLGKKYDYHLVRSHFILQQGLTDRFNFGSYLRKCMRAMVAEWVKIHWTIWLFVLLAISLSGVRYWLGSSLDRMSALLQFMGTGWFMLVLGVLIIIKSRRILYKLASSNVLAAPIISTGERTSMSSDMMSDYLPMDADETPSLQHPAGSLTSAFAHSLIHHDVMSSSSRAAALHTDNEGLPHRTSHGGLGLGRGAPGGQNGTTNGQTAAAGPQGQSRYQPIETDVSHSLRWWTSNGSILSPGAEASVLPFAAHNYPHSHPHPPQGLHNGSNYPQSQLNQPVRTATKGMRGGRTRAITCSLYLRHILCVRPGRLLHRIWARILNPFAYPAPHVPAQIRLFWFQSARFLLYVVRFLLFFHVGYIALYILYFYNIANQEHAHGLHPFILLPVILFTFAVVPFMLPTYSIIANVGYLTKHKLVALTLKQQQHEGTI